MLLTWLLVVSVGAAQEAVTVEADGFVVEMGDTVATVKSVGVPFGVGLRNPDRVCRVSVDWRDGKVTPAVANDCHPGISWAADEALALWDVDVTSPPARDRRLFEVWYVFPERRGGEVRTLVRQAHDATLTLRAPSLELLDYQIDAMLPPRYPGAALDIDTTVTTCAVDVDAGTARQIANVRVRDCDAVFHDAAERAARGWVFAAGTLSDVSLSTGLTYGVQFQRNLKGDGGTAFVQLPSEPDLGGRERVASNAPKKAPPVRPSPTNEPIFALNHRSYAEVAVHEMSMPAPLVGNKRARTCNVLVQVNSAHQVWVWPERCDAQVREQVVEAVESWWLQPGTIERGEWYARFRGTFVFSGNGEPVRFRVPQDDLTTKVDDLPDHIETYRAARAVSRVPPKIPQTVLESVGKGGVECKFTVDISRRGRPEDITPLECPGDYVAAASKAISKWRWRPAQSNGVPLASTTQVRVRFGGTP